MKVKRLIELLTEIDPELDVFAEGCDCVEEAVGISIPTKESYYGSVEKGVMIRRNRGVCEAKDGEIKE